MKRTVIYKIPMLHTYLSEIYIHDSMLLPFIVGFVITCLLAYILNVNLINPLFYVIFIIVEAITIRESFKLAYWVIE